MRGSRTPNSAFRLPWRTLRIRLAVLYGAFFCVAAGVLLAGVAVLVQGGLVRRSSSPAPSQQTSPTAGCSFVPSAAHPCFVGTTTHHVPVGLVVIAVVLVALSVGVGWLIAGRSLRPLREIITSARAISASNLHERLALGGPDDEFTELGETLDDLFGRLEASFESQRRFVANASHELRTPLAAERTLLQVALADPGATALTLRSACQEVLELGEQQERLIGALLTLASSERGVERWEPFDLAEVAGKVILDRRHEAERRGIRVDSVLSAAPVTGDPALVESLVANLADNALRYNLPGGRVEISTTTAAGQAVISVSNTGTVIPPGEVDRLFEPFQRLGTERVRRDGGLGLGLAIVRAIASAHGATLAAQARPAGGLDIEVRFPDLLSGTTAGHAGSGDADFDASQARPRT
jgi:signal transduction histidine kinase